MSERYFRLFTLSENLYALGSPVIIAAGALLKDNQTGKVLAQLKIRNISKKAIKAATVCIYPCDVTGNLFGTNISHQYLDLIAARNEEFGSKVPIFLPDVSTRSYKVSVLEVIFSDNTTWKATDEPWEPLSNPSLLDGALRDRELVKQYHIKFGFDCRYEPKAQKDLWYCTCGELNHKNDAYCCRCGKNADSLLMLDLEQLKRDRDERIAAEQQRDAKEKMAAEAAAKKTRKAIIMATPIVAGIVFLAILLMNVIIPNCKYNKAVALMNVSNYADAIVVFESVSGHKDSNAKIAECRLAILDSKYENAVTLMSSGKYEEAIAAFGEITDHKDSSSKIDECYAAILNEQLEEQYNNAVVLMNDGNYKKAMTIFAQLGDYKDSDEKGRYCFEQDNREVIKNAKVGDTIYYGIYEQDNNLDGIEYISWIVLDKQDDKLLLLSQYVLDNIPMGTSNADTTWETSAVRKWLNGEFLDNYFTDEEKTAIPTVPVVAEKVIAYTSNPGNDTLDQVFLLSYSEVELYLGTEWEYKEKLCAPTYYAVANGVKDFGGTCYWWLRTSAHSSCFMAITQNGMFHRPGEKADTSGIGLRPAMWIDLNVY